MARIAYILCLIACLFTSCRKEAIQEEYVDVTLSCSLEGSKASTIGNESLVSNCYLFIFDNAKRLIFGRAITEAERSELTIKLRSRASYEALVIANPPSSFDIRDILSPDDLYDIDINLDNEGLSLRGPFMYAKAGIGVLNANKSISLVLKRALARVTLCSVSNRLPAGLGTMKLRRAYLCNASIAPWVEGSMDAKYEYGATEVYNASAYWANAYGIDARHLTEDNRPITSALAAVYPAFLYWGNSNDSDTSGISIERNSTDSTAHYFYAYENLQTTQAPCASTIYDPYTATTLMVVVEIQDVEYYYPIALVCGLAANSNINVSLSIMSYGNKASEHFHKIDKVACSSAISMSSWTAQAAYNESI